MVAKANTITRAVEVISIANRFQEHSHRNNQSNKKEKKTENKKNPNKKDTYIPYDNLMYLPNTCPNYTVDIKGFSKEVRLLEENFVYEDYISKLIHSDSTLFKEIYDELGNINFLDLPRLVNNAVIQLAEFCEEKGIYINNDKMYDLLFKEHEEELAIKYFREHIIDIEITTDKITKIYNSLDTSERYTLQTASNKVRKFKNLVKLLSV